MAEGLTRNDIFVDAGRASGAGQGDGGQDVHHHSASFGHHKERRRDLRAGEGNRRGDGHSRRLDIGRRALRSSARPSRGRDGVKAEPRLSSTLPSGRMQRHLRQGGSQREMDELQRANKETEKLANRIPLRTLGGSSNFSRIIVLLRKAGAFFFIFPADP